MTNSILDQTIADRIYSENHHPKTTFQSYDIGCSKKNQDSKVISGDSFVASSELPDHRMQTTMQELPIAKQTTPRTTEAQPLARNNGSSPRVKLSEQTFEAATCGPTEIFSCRANREHAIKEHQYSAGSQERRFPDIFRYGIHYEPPTSEPNPFKMVSIMNLPIEISLEELMGKIRGGTVVSCNLLDTKSITGRFSALVRFLHGHEALAYDEFAAAHPIIFRGLRAHVTIVKTPSYPLSMPHTKAILNHHHTRCLEVVNFPPNIPRARLNHDLHPQAIEHMHKRTDGILEMRFSSIDHAGRAFGVLNTFREYRQCGVCFSEDPCALSLETLMVPTRKDRNNH